MDDAWIADEGCRMCNITGAPRNVERIVALMAWKTKAPALPGLTARATLRRFKRDAYSDSTQRLQPTRR
jgi:hypothetical protein